MLKIIPLDPELVSSSTENLPTTNTKCSRRYSKFDKLVRKRHNFRQRRRLPKPTTTDQPHQLYPINLSGMSISPDQVNLLKKGPSFCPMPKDINWQCVYDFEGFEARLRTAVSFIESKPEMG